MAEQLGVDLNTVTPASPTGVIKQSDLGSSPRLQKAQLAVAKAVTTSLGVPQFSISKTLQLSNALPSNDSERLAQVTSAWLKTLDKHGKLNSQFTGDQIVQVAQVRIAYLTKTLLGFVAPVIPRDQANATGIEAVLTKAKNNQIAVENLSGATTSITDLLGYGLDSASLLLLPPQTTALTLAATHSHPGEVRLTVSLSVDHRVADPGDAAEALSSFERFLENG
jgi:pyruvate dehydrogenase E2 component (dihydrolipoamide acetyltransferase)